ncbi:22047_t:CDS:2 [Gigaspora margarita]|uniref:22047_t:CDS:1 n=1 Tax=Gigaspora margarita TaxID=4874 RepID=A0ABN7UDY1_GIGMA|nr:22047_t:CDS:2 [Gigaspora margarita]
MDEKRNSSTSYVDNNLDFSKLTLIDHPNVNDEHITHGGSTSYINSNLVFNKLIDPQKEALSSSSPTSHTEEESDVDKNDPSNEVIMQLINMGFSKAQAIDALEKNNYDPYQAITYLLNSDI